MELLPFDRLGWDLERVLAAERADIGPAGAGAPSSLLATATTKDPDIGNFSKNFSVNCYTTFT